MSRTFRIAVLILAATGVLAPAAPAPAQTVLVPQGATWKYLDNGSDQGTAWHDPGFQRRRLGDRPRAARLRRRRRGHGRELSGPNAASKYITTYFRHAFTWPTRARSGS